jgi:hypothetical protein
VKICAVKSGSRKKERKKEKQNGKDVGNFQSDGGEES